MKQMWFFSSIISIVMHKNKDHFMSPIPSLFSSNQTSNPITELLPMILARLIPMNTSVTVEPAQNGPSLFHKIWVAFLR